MAKNKYNYKDSQNTSILTHIFNNATKNNAKEENSVLDSLTTNENTSPIVMPEISSMKTNLTDTLVTESFQTEKEQPFKFDFEDENVSSTIKEEKNSTIVNYESSDDQKSSFDFDRISEKNEIEPTKNENQSFKENVADNEINVIDQHIEKHDSDIHSMFERINNNVKEATDIFNQNIKMRNELVNDMEKLEEERNQIINDKTAFERRINEEYQRLNQKKDSQEAKLKESKMILEREIQKLEIDNQKLEQERNNFEVKKNEEYNRFSEYKEKEEGIIKSIKSELDLEKEKLDLYKNDLEEEKRRFKISQVKLDNERNELAINLNKFNELVNNFTFGISKLPNE